MNFAAPDIDRSVADGDEGAKALDDISQGDNWRRVGHQAAFPAVGRKTALLSAAAFL
jgi:hypothetical protein